MAQINQASDPTGALTQVDLHGADISTIINEFNKLQDQLTGGNIRQNQQNIIVYDNTTNRVLMGYQNVLQAWGLFVSKVGVDVTTATAAQLILNSNQDVFKIVQTGTLTIPGFTTSAGGAGWATNNSAGVVVNHNLGFVPAIIGFGDSGGGIFSALLGSTGSIPANNCNFYVTTPALEVTSTQIIANLFTSANFSGAGSVVNGGLTVRYYLLQETAN